jgi:predicted N-formylglutamate amidohydrolase
MQKKVFGSIGFGFSMRAFKNRRPGRVNAGPRTGDGQGPARLAEVPGKRLYKAVMSEALSSTSDDRDAELPLLRAADEPAPYEVINEAGRAPVLLVCDHASNFIPRALDDLGLGPAELQRHIAWDIGIAEVTRGLAVRLDAPAVISHFSRLIIDPNRSLDTPGSIPLESDNVVIPGNQTLSLRERQARVAQFFRPYQDAIGRYLDRLSARGPGPAMISMHSFTPVIDGRERPWKVGVLWNRDPRIPVPVMDALRACGIPYGDNEPYSGRDYHGYTIHQQAEPRGLPNVLLEVRQDLIDTRAGAAEWVELLAGLLAPILADPAIYEASSAQAGTPANGEGR